jgi:RNA polymerase sigma factor (sigma-70 family)
MANYNFPEARAALARTVAEEGIVLLKNEGNMLPLHDEAVAVFGRTQIDTIKCGTGSAFCESEYMVDILTGLENAGINVDRELADTYRAWIAENGVTSLGIWGTGAHCNPEMPMIKDTVKLAATRAQKAIVVIGRTAGENDDVMVTEGDYLLSADEKKLIERTCRYFPEVAIVINSGNLIDLSFTTHDKIKAVVLLNLPGMEGGNALGNVLSGKVTPSGKLTDTIAKSYEDYPSSAYFGKKSGIIEISNMFKNEYGEEVNLYDLYAVEKSAEEILIEAERNEDIRRLVASLPSAKKRIIQMRIFGEYKFSEIAEVMKVKENTVKTIFYRTMDELRKEAQNER